MTRIEMSTSVYVSSRFGYIYEELRKCWEFSKKLLKSKFTLLMRNFRNRYEKWKQRLIYYVSKTGTGKIDRGTERHLQINILRKNNC